MIRITIFINAEAMIKLLNGLIINAIIRNIEIAEQVHIFFVSSVNVIKLK
jgi:hypothetical protein